MTQTKFESGATTHAVNDLILFTDNTRELAELRDRIYSRNRGKGSDLPVKFVQLLRAAQTQYMKEFPELDDHKHIRFMDVDQMNEYVQIYADDFETWKKEHGL